VIFQEENMLKINNRLDKVTLYLSYIGAVALSFVALFVFANVVLRTVFNHPLIQTYEVIQFGTLLAISLVLPRTTLLKSHVKVTFIEDLMSKGPKRVLQTIMNLVCAGVFLYLSINFVELAQKAISNAYVTDIMKIPYAYVYMVMSVSVGVSGLIFILNIANTFTNSPKEVIYQSDSPDPTVNGEIGLN
jgi:TRAP-type C4-dicarboxylate transport system permease small subunit